jgi:hypothetical protein
MAISLSASQLTGVHRIVATKPISQRISAGTIISATMINRRTGLNRQAATMSATGTRMVAK